MNLCPPMEIEGETLTLMPHLAAAIDKRLLRKPVMSVAHRAGDFGAALDAVLTGA